MNFYQYIVPVPTIEEPSKKINDAILLSIPERYDNDKNNRHHWTTKWVWNKIIPMLSKHYKFNFNEKDYDIITNKTEQGDYSYHNIKTKYHFRYIEPELKYNKEGDINILRLKDENFIDPFLNTPYHKLYRGSHKISVVENLSIKTNRILLINGDSMTIPIIPIIVNYFDKVICLDARSNADKKIENLINWDEITDYLCMFTTNDWCEKKLPQLYLHPYLK